MMIDARFVTTMGRVRRPSHGRDAAEAWWRARLDGLPAPEPYRFWGEA